MEQKQNRKRYSLWMATPLVFALSAKAALRRAWPQPYLLFRHRFQWLAAAYGAAGLLSLVIQLNGLTAPFTFVIPFFHHFKHPRRFLL